MTLSSYIDSMRNKSVAVIGIGVSNLPLLRLLLRGGCRVTACDMSSREALGRTGDELETMGCRFRLGENYLEGLTEDIIFRTPGLLPFTDELVAAQERGAVVTSEMEVFFALCPCRILAVTGSDGKTTTTTVISELLKAAGYMVWVGGNIGTPLLDRVDEMRPEDVVVLELSSFQLHSMKCHPQVAVVTNIAMNHLDKHHSYADYQQAKKQIFAEQDSSDRLILNYDNEITRAMKDEAPGQVVFFSRVGRIDDGVTLREGVIGRVRDGEFTPIVPAEDILVPGVHNVENFMAAFAATEGLVSDDVCAMIAKSFPGVAHRLEMIRVLHGVTYCNDSIASTPSRTVAGLHAMKRKPLLIAGGSDKDVPFDQAFGDEICLHVKELFLTGNTAKKIRTAVESSSYFDPEKLRIHEYADFRETVFAASARASEGDIVLLSPACPSFDHFKNFVERGNAFRAIVAELA